MKNIFNRFKEAMRYKAIVQTMTAAMIGILGIISILHIKATAAKYALANSSGEGFVDSAIKILMAVVIGALLLAGLYTLFGNTVLPTLTQRVIDMFNFSGN